MTVVIRSQQVAPVSRRTFVVVTKHRRDLVNGEANASTVRGVFLDALRELGQNQPDLVEYLYRLLQGDTEVDPADGRLLQTVFRSWETRVVGEAAEQLARGGIALIIQTRLPAARTGERNRAQVRALAHIDRYGLRHDEGDHTACVRQHPNPDGVFFINVATVRALIRQGDIEPDGEPEYLGSKSEPDTDEHGNIVWSEHPIYDYQAWRLTEQGRRLMELGIRRYQTDYE